jgi:uncharacterized protein (DUF1697 family)
VAAFVAMLRAINLGSRNRVSMSDLKQIVVDLGGKNPETYVQSGNVVFSASGKAADIERELERRLDKDLGVPVRALVRSAAQMKKVAASNPFVKKATDEKQLHVTFLADTPKTKTLELPAVPDEAELVGREVYLLCPNGYGVSKLSNAFFEKKLDVAATTRNWKTVNALAEMATSL